MITEKIHDYRRALMIDDRDLPSLIIISAEDYYDVASSSHMMHTDSNHITIMGIPFQRSPHVKTGEFIAFGKNMEIM